MVTIGTFQINAAALDGWKKSDFVKQFAGKIPVDIDEVWRAVTDWRKANKRGK